MPNAQTLPNFGPLPATFAAWPVWSGSTTKPVIFRPLPKKQATRLFHQARDYDRQTKRPGQHGGDIGHAALQVLHCLLFDFLNYASGRLDPSYAAIARKANVCQRTVATSLKKLKTLGLITWLRRCGESRRPDGRFVLEQETNAYAVLPPTSWRGYRPPPPPPKPDAGTWGDHPGLPSVLHQAQTTAEGGTLPQLLAKLESDPGDALAVALARFGRHLAAGHS